NIFASFVDRFYTLRQEFASANVETYEHITKKLLNSLYGKFGQKAEVWEKIGDAPNEPDRVEDVYEVGVFRTKQIRYLLGEVFELTGYGECFNSFPAISAHVTAYGRMYLYELMKAAGSGNYFYCDTDSLIVNEAGLWNLENRIDKQRLGSLKVVSTTTKLVIRGLKDYSVGEKTIIKGIRKNAVRISDNLYSQDVWPSFKGVLRSGTADTYTIRKTLKQLSRNYTKGKVNPDGWIIPLEFDDCSVATLLPFSAVTL
ncbi:unnamed protein product, partial [marine sediment metagenome]